MRPSPPESATPADRLAVARLIHASTNAWYERQGGPPVFACRPEDCAVYFDTYEALDPGRCLVVRDLDGDRLLGSCFVHPRDTHLSLGIMNVAPDAFGQGVASRLLEEICAQADDAALPLRLVSSAGNLDSFSLYNSRGFVPIQVFQDVLLTVPDDGLPPHATTLQLRTARIDDVPALVDLERRVHGMVRDRDLEFFVADPQRCFRLFVASAPDGRIAGWLASVRHAATSMLGPGVMVDHQAAAALIHHALDRHHRGDTCLWLVPSDRPELVRSTRRLGARNVELHLAQVRAPRDPAGLPQPTGPQHAPAAPAVVLPTFLPETG